MKWFAGSQVPPPRVSGDGAPSEPLTTPLGSGPDLAMRPVAAPVRRGPHLSLRTKGILVVVLPATALLGATGGLFLVEHMTSQREASLQRTTETERATGRILQLVTDAQAGVRGYVTVTDEVLLASEQVAERELPATRARLERLTRGTSNAKPAARLGELAARQVTVLEALKRVAEREPRDDGEIKRLVMFTHESMASVRGQAADLLFRERQAELAERRLYLDRTHLLNEATLILSVLSLLGGMGASGLLMGRIVRRVRLAESNARALAEGRPVNAVAVTGDDEISSLTTSIAAAAELIEEQRRRFGLALELGRINVWTVSSSGTMTVHGDRSTEYGMTHESALVYFDDEDAQLMRDLVVDVLRDGKPREYEIVNRFDQRHFAGRAVRLSQTEVLGASIDVTALRQAEQQVREEQARRAANELAATERRGQHFAAIVGSAGDGILTVDANDLCTSVNPAAAAMLGFAPSELLGKRMHPIIHHSRPDGTPYPRQECAVWETQQTGRSQRVDTDVFWRKDGSRLPVEYTTAPMKDDAGADGVVVLFTDASERRQTSELVEREAAELRGAIRRGELVLHFQPKVALLTGRVHSVEGLVRWQRADRLAYPDEFIVMAEQTGVIGELTDWAINAAADQAAAWKDDGLDLRVGVNLSALSFTDDHIVDVIVSATERHGLTPSQLEVEVTETAVAADPDAAVRVLSHLARLGVHRAMDDFGTGYSSLAYLKHLPLSELKIDKSFVMNMPGDVRDQAIVAAAVHLARSLGLKTTAEGVETALVLEMLRAAECTTGQGYHWSKPVPAAELAAWVRARDAAPERRAVSR